jgi:hypothetical protein
MNQNDDEKLDSMLRSRRSQAASADLAERIILKAQGVEQVRNVPLWQWLGQSFAEFHLPKPGYVLASALVLGMVLGFSTTAQESSVNETNAQSAASFLTGDEGLL